MKQEPKDPCKACVCSTCSKSPKNGNMYTCNKCKFPGCTMRRAFCCDWVGLPGQDEGGEFNIWRM